MPRHDRNKWTHQPASERLDELEDKLDELLERRDNLTSIATLIRQLEKRLMAAIDDLKAAVAENSTEVNRIAGEVDQLVDKLSSTPAGTSDADIQAIVDQLKAQTAALRAASDKSDAAVPG